jgi:hypothetical protein
MRLEDVTTEVLERWRATLTSSNRTVAKHLGHPPRHLLSAMKVWGVPSNPAATVERPRYRVSDDLEAYSPEEVWALVRGRLGAGRHGVSDGGAHRGCGLGELLAWQWRDIDCAGGAVRVRRSHNVHGGVSAPRAARCGACRWSPGRRLGARATCRPRVLGRGRGPGVCQRAGHLPGRLLDPHPLSRCPGARGTPPAPLPRSAPHVRHPCRPARRGAGRPGVDGPRRHPDHDALCPPPRPRRRSQANANCKMGTSKPAGRGSPSLGRFDSFAASGLQVGCLGGCWRWLAHRSIPNHVRGSGAASWGDGDLTPSHRHVFATEPVRARSGTRGAGY